MKNDTRKIIALRTIINGIYQFLKIGSKLNKSEKRMMHFSPDIKDATNFETPQQATEAIDTLHNPHRRLFSVVEETITFHSRKERNQFDRISN